MDDVILDKSYKPAGQLKGIVDTGTSAIVGPKEIVSEMTKIFPKNINCSEID